jgi:hypothetical protein
MNEKEVCRIELFYITKYWDSDGIYLLKCKATCWPYYVENTFGTWKIGVDAFETEKEARDRVQLQLSRKQQNLEKQLDNLKRMSAYDVDNFPIKEI